jgi:hypothetical protein
MKQSPISNIGINNDLVARVAIKLSLPAFLCPIRGSRSIRPHCSIINHSSHLTEATSPKPKWVKINKCMTSGKSLFRKGFVVDCKRGAPPHFSLRNGNRKTWQFRSGETLNKIVTQWGLNSKATLRPVSA